MRNDEIKTAAEELMRDFAARTGIAILNSSAAARYLWTDAFAVFNFLALARLTGDDTYLNRALRLVDLVHLVLGRHRDDDPRKGWISGLSESEGKLHPTRGGLRIGKRLNERGRHDPSDDQLEWERDGQYFHYLTKWMHALNRVSLVTGDARYNEWGLELAETAHKAFVHQPLSGGPKRIYWKMSIDLSRPLVPSMGQFDPLDGFVAYSRLQASRNEMAQPRGLDLSRAVSDLHHMCERANWLTNDELGIGGLLTEAGQLSQLIAEGFLPHLPMLDDLLADAEGSLHTVAAHNRLDFPAEARLAFRELGLSIGLQALQPMRDSLQRQSDRFRNSGTLLARVDALDVYSPLIKRIERFWLEPAHQRNAAWTNHREINSVMLAASLVPHVYLMSDPDLLNRDEALPAGRQWNQEQRR